MGRTISFAEWESMRAHQQNTYLLYRKISNGDSNLESLGEEIPAGLCVNQYEEDTMRHLYLNRYGYQSMSYNPDSLTPENFFTSLYDKETISRIHRLRREFLTSIDVPRVNSFFQQVRNGKGEKVWICLSAKIFNHQRNTLIFTFNPVYELVSASRKGLQRLDENDINQRYFAKFQALTRREKEVISLLFVTTGSKEIGERLNISVETVKQHRKNIKRKLEYRNLAELVKFAQTFDLL